MNTILKAISNHLTQHGIKHDTATYTIYVPSSLIMLLTGRYTLTITDINNKIDLHTTHNKHTTLEPADPQLLPKILHEAKQAINQTP